jgi:hypothetical protein
VGERRHDGEAEAGSAPGAAAGAVAAGEPVERLGEQIRREAGTVVGDHEPAPLGGQARRDEDAAPRVAVGVGDEVGDDLADPERVAADDQRLAGDLDRDVLPVPEAADGSPRCFEHFRAGVTG